VLAFVDRIAMDDLAEVDAVAQQVEQRAATERLAANVLACGRDSCLRGMSAPTVVWLHRNWVQLL